MLPVLAALLLVVTAQAPPDRGRAVQLARGGHTAEALALFTALVDRDPADVDARLWIARLELRLGHVEQAEATFRDVLAAHPADVDAMVGLGRALTRRGAWREALDVLLAAERTAGENADLFAALARVYRRAGDDAKAREYFRRAYALSPNDPDVVDGLEAVTRAYGHSLAFEGFRQGGTTAVEATDGSLSASIRAAPRLHVEGLARGRTGTDHADTAFGGGVVWRAARATTVALRASGGAGNTSLPARDVSGEIVHYRDVLEIGGGLRLLSFAGADVTAVSPTFAYDGWRWRIDGRYTYSRSRFSASGGSSGDHSAMLRSTWRGWRRVWITSAYAYGIESFEVLTAARLGSLGATTVSGGVRVGTPSLAVLTATWEHQWQSNARQYDRVIVGIVQAFP